MEEFQKYKVKCPSELEFTEVAGALGMKGTIISLAAIIRIGLKDKPVMFIIFRACNSSTLNNIAKA